MTDTLDRRPAWLSAGLATGLVATLTLVFGVFLGRPLTTVVGLTGAVGVARTATTLASSRAETARIDRAGASIVFVLGILLLVVPWLWLPPADAFVVTSLVVATAFVGLAGADAVAGPETGPLFSVCWRSRDVFAVAAVVFGVVQSGLLVTILSSSVTLASRQLRTSFVGAVVSLEVLVYLVLLLLPKAQRALEERVGTTGAERIATITVGGRSVESTLGHVRSWVHDNVAVVALQLVILLIRGAFVERLLLAADPIGPLLRALLASGVVHLPLLLVAILSGLVLVGAFVHSLLVENTNVDPPAMAADSVGALVVATVVGAISLALPAHLTGLVFVGSPAEMATVYGPAAILLGTLAVVALAVPIAITLLSMLATATGLASSRTSGFLVGAGLVLFAAVVGAEQELPAILIFVAVAVAILTWDLGEQARYLGVMIGNSGVSDDVETLHATAAIGVGVVGVLIAAVAGYLLGPVTTTASQAFFGLALAVVAAVLAMATLKRGR